MAKETYRDQRQKKNDLIAYNLYGTYVKHTFCGFSVEWDHINYKIRDSSKMQNTIKLLPTRNGAQMKVKPTAELRYKL